MVISNQTDTVTNCVNILVFVFYGLSQVLDSPAPADDKCLGLGLRLGETEWCEEGLQHFSGKVSVDLPARSSPVFLLQTP